MLYYVLSVVLCNKAKKLFMAKVVTFGEMLLRLTAPDELRLSQTSEFGASYGGSESNVAVSLATLGLDTEYITRLPDNELGRNCVSVLRSHNVGTDYILFGGKRIGIYFLENGAVYRSSDVVYDRDDSSYATLAPGMIDWHNAFKDATWFHFSGIAAAISKSAALACEEAINIADEMGLTISCDLNFREKLWTYGEKATDVIPRLAQRCDVMFGSQAEYSQVFGVKRPVFKALDSNYKIPVSEYESAMSEVAKLCPRCNKFFVALRYQINSNHNTFSGVLYENGKVFLAPVYDITHVVDKIGVGDAFAAGMIFGLNTYNDDKETLKFATACSALKNTIYGDFNLATREEVEGLMNGDGSGRVSR